MGQNKNFLEFVLMALNFILLAHFDQLFQFSNNLFRLTTVLNQLIAISVKSIVHTSNRVIQHSDALNKNR